MQSIISYTEVAENWHYLTIGWKNAQYNLYIYINQQFSVDIHLAMFASQGKFF